MKKNTNSYSRKRKVVVSICLMALAIILLAGCEGLDIDKILTPPDAEKPTDTQEPGISYETKVHENNSNKRNDTIKFPQFKRNGEDMAQINALIENHVLGKADHYSDDYETSIDIDYQVTFVDSQKISITFSGLSTVKSGAYPNNEFFTLTIDVDKASVLRLKDSYIVNDELIKVYLAALKQQGSSGQVPKGAVQAIEGRNGMKVAFEYADDVGRDNIEGLVSSYFTEDGLGISMPVIHALGDHVETVIKYEDIKQFKK
jgi:hypothetical protein